MFDISRTVHLSSQYIDIIPKDQRAPYVARYADAQENRQRYYKVHGHFIGAEDHWADIAEWNGKVVGFHVMKRQGYTLYLCGLFINQKFQGLGIGKTLLNLAIQRASKGESFELKVLRDNTRARHLYERLGFVDTMQATPTYYGAEQATMIMAPKL